MWILRFNTASTVRHWKWSTAETISDDLSWYKHIDVAAAKASRILGFLRRNLGECTKEVKVLHTPRLLDQHWNMHLQLGTPPVHRIPTSSRKFRDRQTDLSMGTSQRGILDVSPAWLTILVGGHSKEGGRKTDWRHCSKSSMDTCDVTSCDPSQLPPSTHTKTPYFPRKSKIGTVCQHKSQTPRLLRSSESAWASCCRSDTSIVTVFNLHTCF